MWTAVLTIAVLALLAGVALAYAWRSLPPNPGELVDEVDRLLPQTQCAQCGYPGCRPYAEAIAAGEEMLTITPPCPPCERPIRRMAAFEQIIGPRTLTSKRRSVSGDFCPQRVGYYRLRRWRF